ncbi:hypothetical protein [Mesorhizobium sp. B1-1-8]|nr:hypothetical protein [Mesorhizobium sp. B1-1-8]
MRKAASSKGTNDGSLQNADVVSAMTEMRRKADAFQPLTKITPPV